MRLRSLFDRVPFFDPIRSEVIRHHQYAQVRESHGVQSNERGPDVRAITERTAPAVDDQMGRTGQRASPFFKVGEALRGGRRSVKGSASDVGALKKWLASSAASRAGSTLSAAAQGFWSPLLTGNWQFKEAAKVKAMAKRATSRKR
jgi:hypothetical protein